MSPILSRLRAETRAEHDAIEAVLDLTGDGLTRDGYRRILERFYGFYAPLEPAIWAVAGRDGERRRRDRGGDGHHRPQT